MTVSSISRPKVARLRLALSITFAAIGLLAFNQAEQPSVQEVVVEHPLTTPESQSWVGQYRATSPEGEVTIKLMASGEFLLQVRPAFPSQSPESVGGSYCATSGAVTLSEPWTLATRSRPTVFGRPLLGVRWGCCRILLPQESLREFCNAVNAGVSSPVFTALSPTILASTDCVGPHHQGVPLLPEVDQHLLLPKALAARVTFTTWANVARVDTGSFSGLDVGMRLYGRMPDGEILEYRVINAYGNTADVKELDTPTGWTVCRRGSILTSNYPDALPTTQHPG